jgi:hypothetical protein
MSIIMFGSVPAASTVQSPDERTQLEVSLRELLDHVAVELAHEYVRLMETAAEVDPECVGGES